DDNPEIFPFSYARWDAAETRALPGGILLDFGRETFAKLCIENADLARPIRVQFGESETEARDHNCVISETLSGSDSYTLPAYAFRYAALIADSAQTLRAHCLYEYLPLERKASFSCDAPEVARVFDVCAHTFHLNAREFFLDGIKRDRWVWGGDAYQSAMVNRYLFSDPAITRRTIRALLGKPPYAQHINCINDYSAYLIIMLWDYYLETGDSDFVKALFPRVNALYAFIRDRLDENGLVIGHPDDWVFIDWAKFDREGPLCAEQILLWKAMDAMAKLSSLAGAPADDFPAQISALKAQIDRLYWDEDQGAYIDGFTSGRRNVTRHANVLAVLYDFAPEKSARILRDVLYNDAIEPITTPFFKFFELAALCHMGDVEQAQARILNYWHPMLALGATSIWEQFDPREEGAQHYAMYGDPYGRSLCHAWGSGPIYLLGRYVAGVSSTDVACRTFDVAPRPGSYRRFEAEVPVTGGQVRIQYDADARTLTAQATRAGGTLKYRGISRAMPEHTPITLVWED
ncbi:MAG: alpha-rhamnosidase, partial [Christensenellales bacterium]